MKIDFHTHTFPDAIVERAMAKMVPMSGVVPATNATIADTDEKMRGFGVDLYVLQPVATKAKQVHSINELAKENKSENRISFGALYPDSENWKKDIEQVLSLGLPGVKLHPDYQGFFIEEERMFPLYDALEQEHIPVLFHTGRDPYSPNLIHATSKGVGEVHRRFPHMIMIAAHLGGMMDCPGEEDALLGEDIYLDLSLSHRCEQGLYERIFARHDHERLLFASDCPWGTPTEVEEKFNTLSLSEHDRRLIFEENAKRILHLK